MSKSDEEKQQAEEKLLPKIAAEAFREAFEEARREGLSVVVADGDKLVEISPDGTRKILKKIAGKVKLRVPTKAAAK